MNFNPFFIPPPWASVRGAGIATYKSFPLKSAAKVLAPSINNEAIGSEDDDTLLIESESDDISRGTLPLPITINTTDTTRFTTTATTTTTTITTTPTFTATQPSMISKLETSESEESTSESSVEDDATQLILALKFKEAKTYEEALKAFSALAGKETPEGVKANYHLGEMYQYGLGVDVNLDMAKAYYTKAPSSALARTQLGKLAQLEEKFEEAKQHFEAAVFLSPGTNSLAACRGLAKLHKKGLGTEPNAEKAIIYYQLAISKGSIENNIDLGHCYRNEGEFDQAFLCYQRVTGKKAALACLDLGHLYREGKDYEKAARCYEAAAQKGWTEAYISHADLCCDIGDFDQALSLFQKGDEYNTADNFLKLGHLFTTASPIENYQDKAFQCFKIAADKGSDEAWVMLGNFDREKGNNDPAFDLYLKAEGEVGARALIYLGSEHYHNHNIAKAIECYDAAEKKGSLDACMCLGEMYETEKDYANALASYQRGPDESAAQACRSLGHLCVASKMDEMAIACYTAAAEKGCVVALNDLGKLHQAKKAYQKAEEYFQQAQGSAEASIYLGNLYVEQQNYFKAFTSYQTGAGKNAAEGLRKLGHIYLKENCPEKAIECYEAAEKKESVEAVNDLGCLYRDQQQYQKAADCFQRARQQGCAEATNNLGKLHLNGQLDNSPNYGEAMTCFLEAATHYPKANSNIGYLYYAGLGVSKNLKEALKYFLLGEKAGSAAACFFLGEFYQKGIEVKPDDAKAIYWYKQAELHKHSDMEKVRLLIDTLKKQKNHLANVKYEKIFDDNFPLAESGNADSQYTLGVMYKHKDRYVKQSDTNTVHYLTLADQNQHPRAAFKLGQSYETRDNIRTRDTNKAIEWYRKARQSTDITIAYRAHERLMMIGSKEDQATALDHFKIAAKGGNNAAYKNLAYMYYSGLGTQVDEKAALFYCRKYVGQDQATLSISHKRSFTQSFTHGPDDLTIVIKDNNRKLSKDEADFEKYFSLAEDGEATAQFNLGLMYLDGRYVKKNDRIAQRYFELACVGDPENKDKVINAYTERHLTKQLKEWSQLSENSQTG